MNGTTGHHVLRGGIAIMTSAALLMGFTGVTAAAPPDGHGHADAPRPGWGCGDLNHVHTGPPGRGNVSPCAQNDRDDESSKKDDDGGKAAQAAIHLNVSAPRAAVTGTVFSFTVNAEKRPGKATSFTDTIHFTSTDGAASLPADSTLTNGSGSFSATLNTPGNQTITATDTTDGAIKGTSGRIAVSVTVGTHFNVSVPATATAGGAFNIVVTALDQNNNTLTTFGNAIHFSSSDGSAVLPADTTLTNGVGTFPMTLRTAGSQNITVTNTSNSSVTGTSSSIAVVAAAATYMGFTTPPTATAGTAFSYTVTAQDQFGNTASTYAGTVHFTTSDGAAVLPADSTLTNGTGTFAGTLNTSGPQTLTATDTANGSVTGTSATITVS